VQCGFLTTVILSTDIVATAIRCVGGVWASSVTFCLLTSRLQLFGGWDSAQHVILSTDIWATFILLVDGG
jgi:hypothetical protein